MECSKCNAPRLCEDLGEGDKRYRCQKCGLNEVRDREGRKLLTDQREDRPTLLS